MLGSLASGWRIITKPALAHGVFWAALLACLAAVTTSCERARIITVSSTVDGAEGSLRAAIARANVSRSPVTIRIPAGAYELTRCEPDDDNRAGDLDITTSVSVELVATGTDVIIRQTCAGERVIDALADGLLRLEGVTVTGGAVVSANADEPAIGGGVRARGDVTLERTTITSNSVTGAPGSGAPAGAEPMPAGAAYGGGLYVEGSLHATDTTFSLNGAIGGAGARAPTGDGNASSGGAAEGGGAYVIGAVELRGGWLRENRAVGGDGGSAEQFPGGGGAARGGGVAQRASSEAPVALIGARVSGNRASGGKFPGVSSGPPRTTPLPPAGDATGGAVAAAGALRGEGLNVHDNSATGGLASEGCIIGGCAPLTCPFNRECVPGASRGGAFATRSTTSVVDSTFAQNRATSGDTRISCIPQTGSCSGSPASVAAGGAVWSERDITLAGSSFTGNVAKQGMGISGVDGSARGGAVASDANLTLVGGEYAQNSATLGHGGALSASAVAVNSATFNGNRATGRAGAIDSTSLTAETVTALENLAGGSGGGAIAVSGDATITASTINRNRVESRQGTGVTTQARGGGISVTGHLALSTSQVIGNSGDAATFLGPATFSGGGIAAGSLSAERVTIADNHAGEFTILAGAPIYFPPGVSGGGGIAATGTVSLRNATVTNNSTDVFTALPYAWVAAPQGAGVLAARVELDHATIADNENAPTVQASTLTTQRSALVAPESQPACALGTPVTSSSYTLVSDESCGLSGVGDRQGGAEFLLGPLTSNGGSVPTRLPAFASVLRDYIPSSACPIATDARGVARPQGPACDVGAVELGAVAGVGATDLAIAFTNPPVSVTAGVEATWELTLTNRGPSVAVPALRVAVPDGVSIVSATASGGGACSDEDPVLCVWSAPVASGASVTISLKGAVGTEVTSALLWTAEVLAPELAPPVTDDRAALTTPIAVSSGVTMALRFRPEVDEFGRRTAIAVVALSNAGPSNAVGTDTQPIEVLFQPAAGVSVEPRTETRLVGSFAPGVEPFAYVEFAVLPQGAPPARLGTIALLAGLNPQPPVPEIAVVTADLELRIFRSSAPQPAGTPVSFRYEITNHGPSAAPAVELELGVEGPTYTWSTQTGSIDPASSGPPRMIWRIGTLAAGGRATLTGTVTGSDGYVQSNLFLASEAMDFNGRNEQSRMNFGPAPNGTADLGISNVQLLSSGVPGQRTYRVTITNAGPGPMGATEDAPMAIEANGGFGATSVSVTSSDQRFTCYELYANCAFAQPLAVGGSTSVDFTVEGSFGPDAEFWVLVREPSISPDHDLRNNERDLITP